MSVEWRADFLAGWLSGAAAILALQPVDTLLTRWQASAVPPQEWEFYRRPAALWRGAGPVLLAAPLQNALLMGGYGVGSRWFDVEGAEETQRSHQRAAIFVGGCTGGP
jgi:solute carrier family 25 (mitochondrial carnitine/acylcarnitine transporter), member 20/29